MNYYNKYIQLKDRLWSWELQCYNLEQHVTQHQNDYTAVIRLMLLKSDIMKLERDIKEVVKQMEVYRD